MKTSLIAGKACVAQSAAKLKLLKELYKVNCRRQSPWNYEEDLFKLLISENVEKFVYDFPNPKDYFKMTNYEMILMRLATMSYMNIFNRLGLKRKFDPYVIV